MTRFLVISIIRLLTGATIRWVGCEPVSRQRVFFANHTSNLDGPVIWAGLPASIRNRVRLVAARDYWMANAVRRYMASRVFRTILIDRRKVTVSNNPLTLLLGALDEGSSLILFPEGGRSNSGTPLPFKSGLYHLGLKRPEVELVPVRIDNLNRVLPKGEILPVPILSCVTFGAPIKVEPGEGRDRFLARARDAIIKLEKNKRV